MMAFWFLILGLLIRLVLPRIRPDFPWICPVLALALPLCAGGFHTGTCAVLSAFLLLALAEQPLGLCANRGSFALLLICAAACLTPLWAADKGMAAFGIVRFLPLVLFALLVMQDPKLPDTFLSLLPLSGCLATVLSLVLLPWFSDTLIVNGRLAGFLQYPNSFAAFLLCGLILQAMAERSKWDLPVCLILIIGIILSGSKTVFVLTVLAIIAIALIRRQKKLTLFLAASLVLGLGAGLLAERMGLLSQADRFTEVTPSAGTFLVRLLYYRDALLPILKHPFGMGYLAYPAIQGTIQTGRYAVTYLHNGFLQLLLELGWIPGLAMAFCLGSGLLSKKQQPRKRLVLLFLLAHCMLDFDLEFSFFWLVLLSCLDFSSGKEWRPKKPALIPLVLVFTLSLWLGTGDTLYRLGKTDLCLKVTPFHTQALTQELTQSSQAEEVDALADRILSLCPTHSVACSGKANAAFARGDMLSMMQHKEAAIAYAPYVNEEYLDYFRKVYTAMELYLRSGDQKSALYCRDKLLTIPAMMEETAQRTTPLAYKTGDDPTLTLPEEYKALLNALAQ